MSIYPIGSLVYLNTGEVSIVTKSNYGSPTRCVVRVLLTPNHDVDQSKKAYDLLVNTMIYVSGPVPSSEEKEILAILNPRGTIAMDNSAKKS